MAPAMYQLLQSDPLRVPFRDAREALCDLKLGCQKVILMDQVLTLRYIIISWMVWIISICTNHQAW